MSKQKTPTIDLMDDDFGCVLNCAVRYALGRRTYMPSLVCDYIKPLLPYLNNRTVWCFKQDIQDHKRLGFSYGDGCDERTWMDFLDAVNKEYQSRPQT